MSAQVRSDDAESCCAQRLSERVVHVPRIPHGRGADHQGRTDTGDRIGPRTRRRCRPLGPCAARGVPCKRSTGALRASPIGTRLMDPVGDEPTGDI